MLEKDLATFGFFVALGRSTRAYLAGKGVGDSEESLASLLRFCLIHTTYINFLRLSSLCPLLE